MIEVMRSSVNTWECDNMGHMNVRHYSARAADGLARLAMELGLGPRQLAKEGTSVRALAQHLRFHREMRPGATFRVRAGVSRRQRKLQTTRRPSRATTFSRHVGPTRCSRVVRRFASCRGRRTRSRGGELVTRSPPGRAARHQRRAPTLASSLYVIARAGGAYPGR